MDDFSDIPESEWVESNELAFAFRDRFPVADGHTLVCPKRVVRRWSQLDMEEQRDVLLLTSRVMEMLEDTSGFNMGLGPHGYNIGVNDGSAAGQTIDHVHVHIIPRRHGDGGPAFGVRNVFPNKAEY